ncbi:hypothetical protein LINPERHAP2_LOCUS1728 [Linum perenne]
MIQSLAISSKGV